MFFSRTMLFAVLLSAVLFSCQTEDMQTQPTEFQLKNGEPVPNLRTDFKRTFVGTSPNGDCITYMVYVTTHYNGIVLVQGHYLYNIGEDCPPIISSKTHMPDGTPIISTYYYKGGWFQDAEVKGKMSDFFNANPNAYQDFLNEMAK